MKKILFALALLATLLVGSPQAHAATGPGFVPISAGVNLDGTPFKGNLAALAYSCPSGYMCLYTGTNGTGAPYPIPTSWTGCRNLVGTGFDNTTSSIYNNTGSQWHVYPNLTSTCQDAGQDWGLIYAHSTGNMTGIFNDTITSYRRL